MSKRRIAMNKVKDILRMILVEDKSMRSIASLTGIPYSTINDNVSLMKQKGLDWSQIELMSEEALECVLSENDNQRPLPNWEEVEKELKRKEVTLQLLWQEYHKSTKFTGYKYSRFCQLYEAWCKQHDVYTPMPHKAGEELFVDYSGKKMSYIWESGKGAVGKGPGKGGKGAERGRERGKGPRERGRGLRFARFVMTSNSGTSQSIF